MQLLGFHHTIIPLHIYLMKRQYLHPNKQAPDTILCISPTIKTSKYTYKVGNAISLHYISVPNDRPSGRIIVEKYHPLSGSNTTICQNRLSIFTIGRMKSISLPKLAVNNACLLLNDIIIIHISSRTCMHYYHN